MASYMLRAKSPDGIQVGRIPIVGPCTLEIELVEGKPTAGEVRIEGKPSLTKAFTIKSPRVKK